MSALSPNDDISTYAPTHWRVIPAINGRGHLLVGPDPYTEAGEGAMVFAPPGVLLRSPTEKAQLTRDGWRQARWGKDRYGHVLVDQARPFALALVSLQEVVEDVTKHTPEHVKWLAEITERLIVFYVGRMVPDYRGCRHPRAEEATYALFRLRSEADAAFSSPDFDRPCGPTWYLRDRAFSNLVEAYIAPIRSRPSPIAQPQDLVAQHPQIFSDDGVPDLRVIE